MIISIDWLKDFVEIKESPIELAELLSKIGLEAEVLNEINDVKGVVIAYVKEVDKHPNADTLKICKIDDGNKIYQVICGAPNISVGQIVPFAMVGAILPGNFKIKKAKIRGVDSYGMICSESELKISDSHEGIMTLPENLKLGKDFMSVYGEKFISIELDVTPNRPDALSHQGVARDIACAKNRKFKSITYKNPVKLNKNNLGKINVSIENNNDCKTYVGGIFTDVKVDSSPNWLIDRLKSVGQKSINNIVDISNYVLLEMGHPTHMFDWDKLLEKKINIRRAKKGEKLTVLDEKKYLLNDENLVISDGETPIALAGIMGGFDSRVTKNTNTIFIESAYFNAITIRKSSKKIQVSTDASKRFERGADPLICVKAFCRIVELVENITGGMLVASNHKTIIDEYKIKKITLRYSELELVIGKNIDKNLIKNILIRLGFDLIEKEFVLECKPPSYRPDILREIDIIEEIARIVGYDFIDSDENLYGLFNYKNHDEESNIDLLKNYISNMGFHQIYSNSLQSETVSKISGKTPIKMMNPLNENMGFLRTSLIPGLLKVSETNIKNSIFDFRLYELGNVHERIGQGLKGIKETKHLAFILHGMEKKKSIYFDPIEEDLFNLKGVLIAVFSKKFNLRVDFIQKSCKGFEHSCIIKLNRIEIGAMGYISKNIIKEMNFNLKNVIGCELDLNPIEKMLDTKKVFKSINFYPKIKRDLNFILKDGQHTGPISELIIKIGKGVIINCEPINIFNNSKLIEKNYKSVTYALEFQHPSRTLEDRDVNLLIDEIISSTKTNFNAILRS